MAANKPLQLYAPGWLQEAMGFRERSICEQRDVKIYYGDEDGHRDPRRIEVSSKTLGASFFYDPVMRQIIG